VQAVLIGASAGCVFNAGLLVLMEYSDDKKDSLRMGLATAGASVGGIVYAIMAERLIERVGFRWAVRSMGFVVLVTMVFPNAVFGHERIRRREGRDGTVGSC